MFLNGISAKAKLILGALFRDLFYHDYPELLLFDNAKHLDLSGFDLSSIDKQGANMYPNPNDGNI